MVKFRKCILKLFFLIGLPLLCIIFFKVFNVYDNVIKHINIEKVITINLLLFLSHIIFPITYNFFYEFKITLISLSLSFFMSAFLLRFSRVVAKYLLYKNKDINTMEDVIIFLGKDDNEDIISTIDENDLYNIVAIISQEKDYSGLYLKGHKVYHLSSLESIIKNKNIRKLFVHSKAYAGSQNNLYEIISKIP